MMEPKQYTITHGKDILTIPHYSCHTLVVGTGAAALCCAERLHSKGVQDVLVITDKLKGGTSRNTGSDKQTYYKLSDATLTPDSPYAMAEILSKGGCMHGDIALVEAINSQNAFYHLLSLGVDFPHNIYGGYTGYKTDHDPAQRGVSLGPYTSKAMVEALHNEVTRRDIPIIDNREVIKLLVNDGKIVGVIALNKKELETPTYGLELFTAPTIVLGVGGPGGFFKTSVYPPIHQGGIGLALEAGAEAVNLTEFQFGIASIGFRWNLSGSYQQVIPSYYSTNQEGKDKQYFLDPFFHSQEELYEAIFLKGYQWPFDPMKIQERGSSLIDLLIFREREIKNRRVFIDFRENPGGLSFHLENQCETIKEYLRSSSVTGATPLERLREINKPAVTLYMDHGIDLSKQPLEIAVAVQHNNGGLAGDIWWESTNISGLFPIGEVNGSHGVYRPGGSALNSGQVGALRAATKIAQDFKKISQCREQTLKFSNQKVLEKSLNDVLYMIEELLTPGSIDTKSYRKTIQNRMTRYAGFIRSLKGATQAEIEAWDHLKNFQHQHLKTPFELPFAFKNRQIAWGEVFYLYAIKSYLEEGGGSRGSFLVLDKKGKVTHSKLGIQWNFMEEKKELRNSLQTISIDPEGHIRCSRIPCRPIPKEQFWFEQVWKEYQTEYSRNNSD